MGYINIDDENTHVYFQSGMDKVTKEAQASAEGIAAVMGLPVGLIINSTHDLAKDVAAHLLKASSVKDALNEYTYQTLNDKGPTLIVMHDAGNEDALRAMQLGTLHGHQYSNLSFISLGSPMSSCELQRMTLKANAGYVGQVNDWRDPVTNAALWVMGAGTLAIGGLVCAVALAPTDKGALASSLYIYFSALAGCGIGCFTAGCIGISALRMFHRFQSYLSKPKAQNLLRSWQPAKVLPR